MRRSSILTLAILISLAAGTAFSQNGQRDQAYDQQSSDQEREDEAIKEDAPEVLALLPGLSASILQPFETGVLYFGGNFHYSFVQVLVRDVDDDDFGGYFDCYGEIGYYKERLSPFNQDIFFLYSMGVTLSFEKNIAWNRSFLIPVFGFNLGGLYFNDTGDGQPSGSGWLFEPSLGMVLYRGKRIIANYEASLFLNTLDLGRYIGVRHSLMVNFNI